ncbi:MAG TPA: hypothetical protein VF575_04440 [Candidatus Saccharimonadales bacterium]|jgi:hypothetical protein
MNKNIKNVAVSVSILAVTVATGGLLVAYSSNQPSNETVSPKTSPVSTSDTSVKTDKITADNLTNTTSAPADNFTGSVPADERVAATKKRPANVVQANIAVATPTATGAPVAEQTTTPVPSPAPTPIVSEPVVPAKPVEPTPRPTFQVVLREHEAYVNDLRYIDAKQLIIPFDIVTDEGYVYPANEYGGMGCRIIAAPTIDHGVLCDAHQKESGYGSLVIQYGSSSIAGTYSAQLVYNDGVTERTAIFDFEIADYSPVEI